MSGYRSKPDEPESFLDESLLPSVHRPKQKHEYRSIFLRYRTYILVLILFCFATGFYVWSETITASVRQNLKTSPSSGPNKQHDRTDTPLPHPLPIIPMRPYKNTDVNLPIIPNYGPPVTAQLGFDHIYVIHHLGHPDKLVRMAELLQLLQITAEFVPVIPLAENQVPASMVQSAKSLVEWQTRHRIYCDMLEAGYRSALVLDDSVDMELNIKTIMRTIHRNLPQDWDMFFPGHCGAFERKQPKASPNTDSIRFANMPIGLHAHAVSHKGARRIVANLRSSPTSSEIINMAIMRLKERGILQMYSLDTPVFTLRLGDKDNTKNRLAGNKRLNMSAINHLDLWHGHRPQATDAGAAK
ncbi:hypothetical protein BX661DRAFT_184435 [Kickxella alabastrina]|uniref:uncharacterized protein n=1 Tax=Kickxella alabastrina TaxID=61397 RepID=UPI002220D126|nr:uncharacterized protein BX661DRAFT_184435 [Kickxella alabastrina]KAI7825945.1 hypothetical protein BX661DRAFT_184435 [Kickxella alabastrina]KAJ1947166.1 hypothetical protein GGF37_000621 [Kickxella alabastrina]